jgi:murein DD-endopeptidase MepM/ murein hydrolase activator NlpD
LLGVKSLRLSGRLLLKISQIGGGFFRFLFKGILYRILAEFYYAFFRFKKTPLAGKTLNELFHHKSVYLFIFTLIALLTFSNLIHQDRANALETKISKTVMAKLVTTDFSASPDEELIEEVASPNSFLIANQEKYLDPSYTLDKQSGTVISNETNVNNFLSFSNEKDSLFKPRTISGAGDFIPQRAEIVYYTVQNGDTVSSIARRFGLTVNTILWANNLTAYSLIRPGDSLMILPYNGILYTVKSGDTVSKIARYYGLEIDKILSSNNLGADLKIGQKIILPGAKKITQSAAVTQSSSYTGLTAIRDLIKAPAAKTSGSKMAWPTEGNRITQYFSWRHAGLDIANKIGTPLYAADDGVVTIAQGGWNGGYGNTIVIDHGGGIKTRYGHASKLFVKVGDTVQKGENIAAMGSTGRSTGSHLHFEVLINGARYNPLNYIR